MFLPTSETPTLEVYLGEAEDKITYCSMKCMEETLDAVNSKNTEFDIPIKLVYFEKVVGLLNNSPLVYRAVYRDDLKLEYLPEVAR